ncbi:tripartite tricarboxylate transporter TctB family protein [Halomonas sp. PAMB 3264]|uniref:tripartite tricarboxylate transporter TctB family protein n=1 Tax=Halomonas sp. PAMB 3264 TaxID=3075222 RepID=UPI00289E65CF|nr:tripartite tricarboxylate transporter TctB family protein [Halomonas sp. PAMB 3264]WNL41831.1 tripartite tricarboxylate transporter TctB family protein [Halomonas sp. PAMB 3264]
MRDLFAGLAFFVTGVATIITAQQFPTLPSLQYGPSLFPSIVGGGFCLGGAALAFNALLARRQLALARGPGDELPPAAQRMRWTMVLPPLAVVFYIVASDYLGAALTMALIMLTLMLVRKTAPLIALAASTLVALAIYFVFSRYLLIPLPHGALFEGGLSWIF